MSESSFNKKSALCLGRCAVKEPMEPKNLLFNTIQLRRKSEPLGKKKINLKESSKNPYPPWPTISISKKVRRVTCLSYLFCSSSFPLLQCHVLLTKKKNKTKSNTKSLSLMSSDGANANREKKDKKLLVYKHGLTWHIKGFWHKG